MSKIRNVLDKILARFRNVSIEEFYEIRRVLSLVPKYSSFTGERLHWDVGFHSVPSSPKCPAPYCPDTGVLLDSERKMYIQHYLGALQNSGHRHEWNEKDGLTLGRNIMSKGW